MAMNQAETFEWLRERSNRLDAAESQLASLRAEVERLKLALVGEEKARVLLNAGMGSVCESRDELKHRVRALESAIRTHREQKADDRCIEDDDRLYEVLGDGVKCDRRVGDKFEMLKNCERFITNRCEGGGWPTYAELEVEVERLRAREAELETALNDVRFEFSRVAGDRVPPFDEAEWCRIEESLRIAKAALLAKEPTT